MKIAVIAGGISPERDVSLSSGCLIANSLASSGNEVVLLDAAKSVDPESNEAEFTHKNDYSYVIPEVEPDLDKIREEFGLGKALLGKGVIEVCRKADVVFIAMHGGMGENGQLQAVFDAYGIRYTGSSYDGCVLAMDKSVTKNMLAKTDVKIAESVTVRVYPDEEFISMDVMASIEKIGYPCVVKPLGCGSSVGVSIVNGEEELKKAFDAAAKFGNEVMVEKFLKGREFSCGVLCGRALLPIEIRPINGFYDYKNKYQKGCTVELCPAPLTVNETQDIMDKALKVHDALHLGTYSRSDFILNEEDNEFYCLEANTLPGMTPTSLLPQEAQAVGLSYDKLCEIIATEAK